jgi:cyanate lyase
MASLAKAAGRSREWRPRPCYRCNEIVKVCGTTITKPIHAAFGDAS